MRALLFSSVLILVSNLVFCQELLKSQFQDFHIENPIEKLYLSTDKQVYTIGENIYYKIYLVDGMNHQSSQLSGVAHVELISRGKTLLDQALKIKNGQAKGDIMLPDTLETGKYTLRSYTQYQLNFGNQFVFSKEVEIISSSMNLSYLVKEDSIYDFQIFPEGGHLVSNTSNTVGFKCVNSSGIGVDISGVLMEQKDTLLAFSSMHRGMGKFIFTPKEGVKYSIKYAVGNKVSDFKIYDIKKNGYNMTLINGRKDARLIVNSNSLKQDFKNTFVLAQIRGQFLAILYPKENASYIHYKIPYSNFPDGVVQLTFFKNGTPLLERIYFNENPLFDIEINHTKKRENVDSLISYDIFFENDSINLNGNASISILQKGSKNPNANIKSYLLLTSDIRGVVENSNYYFNNRNLKRSEHLDLLMLTQGWRNYDWDNILSDELTPLKISAQSGLSISGIIRSIKTNTGVPRKASLYVMNNFEFDHQFASNSDGLFKIENLNIQDSVKLIVQAMKEKRLKGKSINVRDEGVYIVMSDRNKPISFINRTLSSDNQKSKIQTSEFDITKLENVKILEDVIITAKKSNTFGREGMFYTSPSKRIVIDTASSQRSLLYSSIIDLIKVEIPGITTAEPGPLDPPGSILVYKGSKIKFFLDGVQINPSRLDFISPFEIELVDLVESLKAYALHKAAVVSLYSKVGYAEKKSSLTGSVTFDLSGFHKAKKFYTPKYQQLARNYLATIFWDPDVTLINGKIDFSFPNYALETGYIVFLEGITSSGQPFVYSYNGDFNSK